MMPLCKRQLDVIEDVRRKAVARWQRRLGYALANNPDAVWSIGECARMIEWFADSPASLVAKSASVAGALRGAGIYPQESQ